MKVKGKIQIPWRDPGLLILGLLGLFLYFRDPRHVPMFTRTWYWLHELFEAIRGKI